MRIGEFSRYFGVSASTVRYYIKYGLLLPDVVNKQHLFEEGCIRDMEHILEWKAMRFSLDKILELITMERKSRLSLEVDTAVLAGRYLEHEKMLRRQLHTVNEQLEHLEELTTEVQAGKLP